MENSEKQYYRRVRKCTKIDKCRPNQSVSIRVINDEWRRNRNLVVPYTRGQEGESAPVNNLDIDTREILDLVDALDVQNQASEQRRKYKDYLKKKEQPPTNIAGEKDPADVGDPTSI